MDESQKSFLATIAKSLYQSHGQNIANITLVFPNRRAGLFFSEYLGQIISAPVFTPEIITIQDLFSNISGLRQEDELYLILRLYSTFMELSGSKESFDEFYLWGEMLLHDFDQVDKYLVDAELLFTNITDLKEIDEHFNDWNEERKEEIRQFWKSLTNSEQKHDQKEFSRLWQILHPVYQKFKEVLFDNQIAYEGMLFRNAIENIEIKLSTYLTEREFVIAGFNALNSCEKKLFQILQLKGNITFYWDIDEYYLNDPNQEAGLFMRENLKLFPQEALPGPTDLLKRPKNLQIFHTSSQMGQAQIASAEVSRLTAQQFNFDDIAVVLCDEELLLPVLSTLPRDIDKVNVTMGLPFRQTPLFGLICLLISLQKKNGGEGESAFFHFNTVIDILNNQLIQSVYPTECKFIIDNIIKKNQMYIPESELGTTDLFRKIFVKCQTVTELPGYFLALLHDLFKYWMKSDDQNYSVNYQEYIFQAYLSINKLNNTLFVSGTTIMGTKEFLSRDTFFKLMDQYLNGMNLSFEGEPLAGLQVMGFLETRTLDFKNVILLSVNEGIMPKANASGSFIPYHLRRGIGLPTLEEQNAMYAYYFYRMLQRAEKVTFVYNSGTGGLKTGEKSRFLYQLQLESPFQIAELGIENSIEPLQNYPISIDKKGKVLEILEKYPLEGKRLTPTALDQYLHCPLSYYFKYIAGFEEEAEVSEEVDARKFGILFHAVMENLYRPFLGKTVNGPDLLSLVNDDSLVDTELRKAFSSIFFKSDPATEDFSLSGQNILVYEVIKKMVVQTIKVDLKKTPFVLKGLEQRIEATIKIFNGTRSIRIGGTIDRIDYISGVTEIIDYKTGSVKHEFNNLAELFGKDTVKRNKAAFQTLVYGYLWNQMNPDEEAVFPAVYELKKIFSEELTRFTIREGGSREVNYIAIKSQFETMLVNLLEEIFNPEFPFVQTVVDENCQFCNFTSICRK